jgi:hypothetical protein
LEPYAKLYGTLLRLPERTTILLTDTPEYRTPFSLWRDLVGGAPFDRQKHVPEWWHLYNESKHHRINVFLEFTLTKAIDALAGALVVIATVPAFASAMLRYEWLALTAAPEGLVRDYWQTLRGQRATPDNQWFTIMTQLLAIPIGHGELPDDPTDINPFHYGGHPRLLRWFRKW